MTSLKTAAKETNVHPKSESLLLCSRWPRIPELGVEPMGEVYSFQRRRTTPDNLSASLA